MAVSYFFIIKAPEMTTTGPLERETSSTEKVVLSARTKLRLLFQLLPYMMPLSLVYFGEYLINQGIVSVMTYPKSDFHKKGTFPQFSYELVVNVTLGYLDQHMRTKTKNIILLCLMAKWKRFGARTKASAFHR
jgi:hypothetical protein